MGRKKGGRESEPAVIAIPVGSLAQALVRAEEDGYNKGVLDMQKQKTAA